MFVGRGDELERLTAGIDDALAGRGRLFFVSGEPGIGKTRLCAATGKSFTTTHIHIFRVAGDRIVEHWAERDDLGMMRQLGALQRAS